MDTGQWGRGHAVIVSDFANPFVPMSSDTKHDPFWEIQLSLAKGVARLPRPSLAKLHYEVLEELGKPPGLDLVDFFVKLANISEEEVREYFRFIGKDAAVKIQEERTRDEAQQLAGAIAREPGATVLKYRQAFTQRFGHPPSEKQIGFFLKAVQDGSRDAADTGMVKEDGYALADRVAMQPGATVLRFRELYQQQFGIAPTSELTQYFLERMRSGKEQAREMLDEDDGEGLASQLEFARTVAGGLITTILQFRQAFEKAYGQAPSAEVTEEFLQHLSRKKEESGAG